MDAQVAKRDVTLVWVDAREALIARWVGDTAHLERIESNVPAHRQSSGHVRHDPALRPGGGGGTAATSDEPHRHEHLARFFDTVAGRLPDGDVEIIGPGTVHEHLAQVVRAADAQAVRRVTTAQSARLTDRQLVARLRHLVGHDPRRRSPGPRGRRALAGRAARASRCG